MQNEERRDGEVQIDLGRIISFVLRKIWIVALCFIIGVVGGYVLGRMKKSTVYETNATYVVYYRGGGSSSINDAATEQARTGTIIVTCVGTLKTSVFYRAVAESYNQGLEEEDQLQWQQVGKAVSFSYSVSLGTATENNGNFIYVHVNTGTKEGSIKLMQAVNDCFIDHIKTYYPIAEDDKLNFSLITNNEDQTRLVPDNSVIKFTAIGAALALIASVGTLAVIEIFDRRVKGEDDLATKYEYPVLGSVPDFEDKGLMKEDYYHAYYHAASSEKQV